jgi:5-methylcytosine-specific restriction endonuclease McrA
MALSKDALGSGQWKLIRLRVLSRDGWVCTYCNKDLKGADATVDHITSRKVGGEIWDMDNLTSACRSCNSRKGSRFFSPASTPPVFADSSLPETQVTRPLSPFQKP